MQIFFQKKLKKHIFLSRQEIFSEVFSKNFRKFKKIEDFFIKFVYKNF